MTTNGRKRWFLVATVVMVGGALALPPSDDAQEAQTAFQISRPPGEQELMERLRQMARVSETPTRAYEAVRSAPKPTPPQPAPVTAEVVPAKLEIAMAEEEAAPDHVTMYVSAGALNVRADPSSSSPTRTSLPGGTAVQVVGESGNWREITTTDGISGWVFGRYLSEQG